MEKGNNVLHNRVGKIVGVGGGGAVKHAYRVGEESTWLEFRVFILFTEIETQNIYICRLLLDSVFPDFEVALQK